MQTDANAADDAHKLRIVDGEALRWVLQLALKKLGTQDKAATALGITQPTFNRLLRGTVHTRIGRRTFQQISDALKRNALDLTPQESRKLDVEWQLQRSVLSFDGMQVRKRYERWLLMQKERLESNGRVLLQELMTIRDYYALIIQFCQRLTRRSELPSRRDHRLWIAIYRALEPLSDAYLTWGVERSWREMHEAGDLVPYLRAALEREQLMLEREPAADRYSKGGRPLGGVAVPPEYPVEEDDFFNHVTLTDEDFDKMRALPSEQTEETPELPPEELEHHHAPPDFEF